MESKKKKKNSKSFVVGILVFITLVAFLLVYYFYSEKRVEEISYTTFFEKWNNKDSFVLVISKTDCRFCELYLPKVEQIAKDYKLKIYYVNVDKFTAEESDSFSEYIDYNSSTPTTVFITNGEEESKLNRINGNVKSEKIIDKLKKTGYIKE